MLKTSKIFVIALSFFLLFSLSCVQLVSASTLNVSTIDYGDYYYLNGEVSIALDSNNSPHIAYRTRSTSTVMYTELGSNGWNGVSLSQVLNMGIIAPDPSGLSLALDSDGNPHISYYDRWDGNLEYVWRDSNGWHHEPVGPGTYMNGPLGGPGWTCSLVLDSANNPHVSFVNVNRAVCYASRINGAWQVQVVSDLSQSLFSSYPSLVLDSTGKPCVAFQEQYSSYGEYSSNFMLARFDGTNWIRTSIEYSADSIIGVSGISLALDSTGNPHVSYIRDGNLVYAVWSGNGWVKSTLASGGVSGDTRLALDSGDNPHISYIQNSAICYAVVTEGKWSAQRWTFGNAQGYLSMALDSTGIPHIAYMEMKDMPYYYYGQIYWNTFTFVKYAFGCEKTTYTLNAITSSTENTIPLTFEGNISAAQISADIIIAPVQSEMSTVVSFTVSGNEGDVGFTTMTIPKSAIPYGAYPVVNVDGVPASKQGFTSDADNYYVWFSTSFSTHQLTVQFVNSPFVVPESIFGTIGVLGTAFAALYTTTIIKARKRKT